MAMSAHEKLKFGCSAARELEAMVCDVVRVAVGEVADVFTSGYSVCLCKGVQGYAT